MVPLTLCLYSKKPPIMSSTLRLTFSSGPLLTRKTRTPAINKSQFKIFFGYVSQFKIWCCVCVLFLLFGPQVYIKIKQTKSFDWHFFFDVFNRGIYGLNLSYGRILLWLPNYQETKKIKNKMKFILWKDN